MTEIRCLGGMTGASGGVLFHLPHHPDFLDVRFWGKGDCQMVRPWKGAGRGGGWVGGTRVESLSRAEDEGES